MRDVFRAVDRRVNLSVGENGKVFLDISSSASVKEDLVAWPRPAQVFSNPDEYLHFTIERDALPHPVLTPHVIVLIWVSLNQETFLDESKMSVLNDWADRNEGKSVLIFTNCKVQHSKKNVVVRPLQCLKMPIDFTKGMWFYDYLDYAKVKAMSYVLKSAKGCLYVDFPKLVPLSVSGDIFDSKEFLFGDGEAILPPSGPIPLTKETWLFYAPKLYEVCIDEFINTIDGLLMEMSNCGCLKILETSLSFSVGLDFVWSMQSTTGYIGLQDRHGKEYQFKENFEDNYKSIIKTKFKESVLLNTSDDDVVQRINNCL